MLFIQYLLRQTAEIGLTTYLVTLRNQKARTDSEILVLRSSYLWSYGKMMSLMSH